MLAYRPAHIRELQVKLDRRNRVGVTCRTVFSEASRPLDAGGVASGHWLGCFVDPAKPCREGRGATLPLPARRSGKSPTSLTSYQPGAQEVSSP
jgi:hypothetical protein